MVSNDFIWPQPMEVSEAEYNTVNPPPRPPMLEWARENVSLPEKTSKISGPWSDEYTPFIRRPMALLERTPVSVWISACTQGCKSTLVQILFAYICMVDPGPTGFVLPQEGDAKKRIRTKIRPLFQSNPDLYAKIGRDVRNLNIGEETDLGDMLLYLIWATSAAKLADATIQNMIYDEVGKFKIIEETGENPIDLGRNRQTTYESIARELGVSSPQDVGDLFDKQMRSGTDEQWHVPCMHCGRWHQLQTYVDETDKAYLVLDRDSNGQYYHHDLYKGGKYSRYICPLCHKAWNEADRWSSNLEGVWVPKGQTMDPNGKISGEPPVITKYSFNIHSMMLYPEFGSVGNLAMQYVEAKENWAKGDKAKLKDWQRNRRGKSWKEEVRVISTHRLEEKKTDLPAGVVPATAKLLTAGADFHKSQTGNVRVDYVVKAWSDDLRNEDILFGHAASLDEMFRITTAQSFEWAQDNGRPELMLACGFIDAGYQPNDPGKGIVDEVYQFCKRYWRLRIWYPIRGRSDLVERFYKRDLDKVVEQADKIYRRRTAAQYRGMELIDISVNQFKDLIADWAEAPFDAPGSTRYNRDMPPEFFEQLTNEYKGKNDKGKWGWWVKEDGLESHALDVSVYAAAAGYYRQVDSLVSEEEMERIEKALAERTQPVRRPPVRRRPSGGGWLDGYRKL